MESGPRESMVPEPVLHSAKATLLGLEALRTQLPEFLSLADPDVLAELPPLQRARALLVLAKAASTLLAGITPPRRIFPAFDLLGFLDDGNLGSGS